MGPPVPKRAAFYIDGFNVYYAVSALKANYLKWVNFWQLAESLIPKQDEQLVRVVWCSAFNRREYDALTRHQKFARAQEACGVTVIMGHYIGLPMDCKECGHEWQMSSEKETDVNLALSIFDDARQDRFDHAYLVTADSDQGATARFLKDCFPEKKLTSVAPPGKPHSKSILAHNEARKIALTADHFERCILPNAVMSKDGKKVAAIRPTEYTPPSGWVPPSKRPA